MAPPETLQPQPPLPAIHPSPCSDTFKGAALFSSPNMDPVALTSSLQAALAPALDGGTVSVQVGSLGVIFQASLLDPQSYM